MQHQSTSSNRTRPWQHGLGQLSVVEHALCPLDSAVSLQENLLHECEYFFTDRCRHTRKARARVYAPGGLSAGDELFVWGLLALTFSQPEPDLEFHATPHHCLRQLGVIDQHARRGGRQYRQFSDAIDRISLVTYQNDAFYDPVRAEHRKVSFGLLSYSLPLDPNSCRAWRFAWDPIYFDFVRAAGGHFQFDLTVYRRLDPASRRLFLLLSKMFCRRTCSPRFELRHLATNVLGFNRSLAPRHLKRKVLRCLERLAAVGVIASQGCELGIVKSGHGRYSVTLMRGPYFANRIRGSVRPAPRDSALFATLSEIGLKETSITRLLGKYPQRLLQEWADITLAARERFGESFFKKSPQAYFVHHVQHAAQGTRSPPDWWHEVRKAEALAQAQTDRERRSGSGAPPAQIEAAAMDVFQQVTEEMSAHFQAAGQSATVARHNAERFAKEHLERRRLLRSGKPALGILSE